MRNAKSPLELYDDINSPFDIKIISRKDSKDTPENRFEKSRLIHLTTDDYFKLVANELNAKWQDLKDQRRRVANEISVKDIAKKMRAGQKFPTPWIHMSDKLGNTPHFQEGLHRMLAAGDVYGDKAKFPVYLGYWEDSKEDFKDIENDDMDSYIQALNERKRQNQIDYDNAEWEKEQEMKKQTKEFAADYFNVPFDKVTDDQIKEYEKYENDLFLDEDDL